MRQVSECLEVNKKIILEQIKDCDDILFRPMKLGKQMEIDCFLVYVEMATVNMMLEDSVIGKMLIGLREMENEQVYEAIRQNALGVSDTKEYPTIEEGMAAMMAGNILMFIDHYDKAIKIGAKGYPAAGITNSESEKVLRGSKEAFCEVEKLNTALIRRRIRDSRLKVKEKAVGKYSNTMTAVVYLEGVALPETVQNVEQKLDSFEIDGVLDSGIIEQLTEDNKYSPFPQYQTTERPDRAAMAILEGRVVVVSDNSPEALILPTTFNTLFQTSDDYYSHFAIVTFLRWIRYIAAFLAVSLPGIYLASINYHTQMVPTNLILSLAKAREGVPFPGLVEVLFLEISFELLREAGLRIPGPIGSTIGIVGGLIIGDAAVSANIVSPVVVVVVAITALSSFSIPNEELSESFRLSKYLMIGLCAAFGLLGLMFGWILLLTHLASLKSFGIPYLMPFSGRDVNPNGEGKDSLFRFPLVDMWKRPIFARKENRRRLRMHDKK